jgi:1,4-alpha-glucan branching enzyme
MNQRNCDTMEKRNAPKSNQQRESSPRRFLASPKLVETTFTLDCPKAGEAFLCGDFNEWSPAGLRMIQGTENGHWEKRLALAPGRYEYKFVVDGESIHDLHACENVLNAHGSLNSVVEVRL